MLFFGNGQDIFNDTLIISMKDLIISVCVCVGTMLVPTASFWLLNGLFMLSDSTGKPTFITRYRIQQDKNSPV